jgi:RNA polymerase sigma factor (sigma-70 family)
MGWSTTQFWEDWHSSHQGDAFSNVMKFFFPVVVNFGCILGLGREDAKDAAQETLFKMYTAVEEHRYVRRKGRFRSYLYGTAHHTIIDHLRERIKVENAQSRQDTKFWGSFPDEKAAKHTWNTEVEKMEMEMCLKAVRQEFGSDKYRAFILHGVQRMKAEKVAAELGMTAVNVRTAKHRVAKRIRELIELLDKQIERDI